MEWDDISDASHTERFNHYLNQLGGATSIENLNFAYQSATAEMLDEIHLMLRRLTNGEKNGSSDSS